MQQLHVAVGPWAAWRGYLPGGSTRAATGERESFCRAATGGNPKEDPPPKSLRPGSRFVSFQVEELGLSLAYTSQPAGYTC